MVKDIKNFLKKIPFFYFGFKIIRRLSRYCIIGVYNFIVLPILLKRIRKKEVIRVVFFVWNFPMWKYDGIYKLLQKHPRFDPIIVLNPSPGKTKEVNDFEIKIMREAFIARGYNVFPEVCYSQNLIFPDNLNPDIISITQPYCIAAKNWRASKYLYFYIPYYFCSQDHAKWMYDSFLQNITWKIFLPTKETVNVAKKLMFNGGKNCISFGYPIFDDIKNAENSISPWKNCGENRLKIIWAPHFSINAGDIFKVSNFLLLANSMIEIAQKYKDKCQFAFKPHPYLFQALCNHKDWGVEKTHAYYSMWDNMPNTQRVEGGYIDLFVHSDAIIHDSHSFTVEYLYTKKPAMYLTCLDSTHQPDAVGSAALSAYYHGRTREDIENFIESVVLRGNDPKKVEREAFYEKYLLPPNGQSVAQNIMDDIERGLGWKK